MIAIDSVLIEEFRGIRKLVLELHGRPFAVCGSNGTGKSGVVDAIEFVLTGSISRLSGEGTDKLSVKAHAPHVDSRNDPGKAQVTLTGTIPSLGKKITIVRNVAHAKDPKIEPADPDVLSVLQQIEDHPEVVLTRREIIRYILATEGNRAQEVQAVLKLDRLEETRAILGAIANAKKKESDNTAQNVTAALDGLCKALGIPKLSGADLLAAVNSRRQTLGLVPLAALESTTSLKDGMATLTEGTQPKPKVSKYTAKEHLSDLRGVLEQVLQAGEEPDAKEALALLRSLDEQPDATRVLAKGKFLEAGLGFVDSAACPFCDTAWDPAALRERVAEKLKSLEALRDRSTKADKQLVPLIGRLELLAKAVVAVQQDRCPANLSDQQPVLDEFKIQIGQAVETLRGSQFAPRIAVLENPLTPAPQAQKCIDAIETYVCGLPEPSKEEAARDYLTLCQSRLDDFRGARRKQKLAEAQSALASLVLKTYCDVSDAALTQLYHDVENDFSEMYGELNQPDEANFEAKLTPSIGKLGFDVNFYGRGYFPPGAYHSEGHQDAMGLCLYLALMRHVLKENFRFAVLDDVLMSVDAGHRRAVCQMLKKRFPNTQFVVTTHDRVWLNHMKTEGMISAKSMVHFRSWDVGSGPTIWHDADVWDQICTELTQDKVPVAAALLRNYLEYVFGEICHQLHARVEFRLDGNMELGHVLPPVYERLTDLYCKGKQAANSFNDKAGVDALGKRHDLLKKAAAATKLDQWQLNAAVHYNAWAMLHRNEFAPLVDAFKFLVEQFRCSEAGCQGLFVVLRDGPTDAELSCGCGKSGFVLREKK